MKWIFKIMITASASLGTLQADEGKTIDFIYQENSEEIDLTAKEMHAISKAFATFKPKDRALIALTDIEE